MSLCWGHQHMEPAPLWHQPSCSGGCSGGDRPSQQWQVPLAAVILLCLPPWDTCGWVGALGAPHWWGGVRSKALKCCSEQLKLWCSVQIVLNLNSKHSTMAATGKKSHSIPAESRTKCQAKFKKRKGFSAVHLQFSVKFFHEKYNSHGLWFLCFAATGEAMG